MSKRMYMQWLVLLCVFALTATAITVHGGSALQRLVILIFCTGSTHTLVQTCKHACRALGKRYLAIFAVISAVWGGSGRY